MKNTEFIEFLSEKVWEATQNNRHSKSVLFNAMIFSAMFRELEERQKHYIYEENKKFEGRLSFDVWGINFQTSLIPYREIRENEEVYYLKYEKGEYTLTRLQPDGNPVEENAKEMYTDKD